MDLFSSLLRGPGFAPSSRAGAPAPTPFVLDDDELLAHFGYFSVAFVGEPWEPGLSFALKIEEMGDYIVAHAEGSIYVCKRAEVVRDHPLTTRAQRPGKIACTVECTAQQVLTLLAGAPADLQASDLQAMQKFLASFRFEAAGYRTFCAARGLRAYEPPADEGSSGMGAKLTSGVGKLTAGASAGISSASRKMSSAAATAAAAVEAAGADAAALARPLARPRASSAAPPVDGAEAVEGVAAAESGDAAAADAAKPWFQPAAHWLEARRRA